MLCDIHVGGVVHKQNLAMWSHRYEGKDVQVRDRSGGATKHAGYDGPPLPFVAFSVEVLTELP